MKRTLVVAWAKGESRVSHFLARALDAEIFNCAESGNALFRYLKQTHKTWAKLREFDPAFIIVQNPPIFATLVVYVFSILNHKRFGIDTHTSGMLETKWKLFFPIHKFLARKAAFNTFHNFKNLEITADWEIPHSQVLQFYTPQRDEILDPSAKISASIEKYLKEDKSKVFMVNRFANDDAFLEVIETAKITPEILFFITGNRDKYQKKMTVPENVILTGFLGHSAFISLMEKCDVVLSLTKRNDTVLWSVREALALRKPIIMSDTEVLKHYFSGFGVFTNHSPSDLKMKIKKAFQEGKTIQEKEQIFIKKDRTRWNDDMKRIKKIIG